MGRTSILIGLGIMVIAAGLCLAWLFISDGKDRAISESNYVSGDNSTDGSGFAGDLTTYPTQFIGPAARRLELLISLPDHLEFNDKAPFIFTVSSDNEAVVKIGKFDYVSAASRLRVPIEPAAGKAALTANLFFSYCDKVDESLCFFKNAQLEIPVEISDGGKTDLKIEYRVNN